VDSAALFASAAFLLALFLDALNAFALAIAALLTEREFAFDFLEAALFLAIDNLFFARYLL
jgi:hypothetical protein